MEIILKKELHPLVEILGLISLLKHKETYQEESIEELKQLGINGERFYKDHLLYLEPYIQGFSGKYIPSPEEDFFFQDDSEFLFLMISILTLHPHWENEAELPADDEIRKELALLFARELDTALPDLTSTDVRFQFAQQFDAGMSFKWKLLTFLDKPGHYIRQLTEIYRKNLPAWQYTFNKNQKLLAPLIAQCPDEINPAFAKNISSFGESVTLYTSLSFPLIEAYIGSIGIYGALVNKINYFGEEQKHGKEILIMLLKALGDKSRLEILYSLKESPKYNLEIAELLHLTPATMSHHMNLLLSNNLVTVEKKDGKVYYQLSKEQIGHMIQLLTDIFL